MAGKSILKTHSLRISHLPSIALLIGYAAYWIELYVIKFRNGCVSPLAVIMFIAVFLVALKMRAGCIFSFLDLAMRERPGLDKISRAYIISGFVLAGLIISIAFYASTLPPHLPQEFDAINYHITIPRQHLILGSFSRIRWSSADLFMLPVDFALSPYELITNLPNKLPQFFFLIGLALVSLNLVRYLSRDNLNSVFLAVFAIIGSHFIGIQMGTAMIDIVICYLFFAALDSFILGNIGLSAVEFCFFFWSKPFIPIQMSVLIISLFLIRCGLNKFGINRIKLSFDSNGWFPVNAVVYKKIKEFSIIFILMSLFVAGPFLYKSIFYSGTPLFPFKPGIMSINKNIDINSESWKTILRNSRAHMNAKDSYGYGKSPWNFLKHLWLIAVPDNGVNNRFDYPAGLPYLIFLGPFLSLFVVSLKKREFSVLPIFVAVYWLSWWIGSQQSRFLYVPVVLMIIVVSSQIPKPSRAFMCAIIVSLGFNYISVFRAHQKDFGVSRLSVLRNRDKEILKSNEAYLKEGRADKVHLDHYDVAYARFPVEVNRETIPWSMHE